METIKLNNAIIKRLYVQMVALFLGIVLMGVIYFNSSYLYEGFLFFGFALSLFGGAVLVTLWSNEIDRLRTKNQEIKKELIRIDLAMNIYSD